MIFPSRKCAAVVTNLRVEMRIEFGCKNDFLIGGGSANPRIIISRVAFQVSFVIPFVFRKHICLFYCFTNIPTDYVFYSRPCEKKSSPQFLKQKIIFFGSQSHFIKRCSKAKSFDQWLCVYFLTSLIFNGLRSRKFDPFTLQGEYIKVLLFEDQILLGLIKES